MSLPPAPSRRPLAAMIALALLAGPGLAQEPADEPYQDRIIAPDKLAPLPPEEDDVYDADGLPRRWSLELVGSRIERGDRRYDERGLRFSGQWDTERWGSLSADAGLFRRDEDGVDGDWTGHATLWQRGLAFDGGWRVDNGLGVLNTPMLPVHREQFRFFLPSVPFAGASTAWQDTDSGWHLQAALGRGGLFAGTRLPTFERGDGDVALAGTQWRWSSRWTGAAAVLSTDGRIVPDALGSGTLVEGRSDAALLSTRWQGDRHQATLNLQSSRGDLDDADGLWLDAESRRGAYTFNYGLFRLDPGLAWGALPINNDTQGGYLRTRYEHGRWSWSLGLDRIASVSQTTFDGHYGSGYLRYQLRNRIGIGASASVRNDAQGTDFSTRWFVDRRSDWGLTRLQLDQLHARDRDDWQLSLDQDLPMRQGSRLALSAQAGQQRQDGVGSTRSFALAALGGVDLGDRVTLDGNLRWTHGSGPQAFRGTDLNLNLAWRVATHWWLQASAYRNRGEQRSPFLLDPLAPPEQFLALPRENTWFLSLRYERQAGRPAAVLGGPAGAATGSIRGTIFLDENADGVRAASEEAVANVTVILDGRYSVRTDGNGNFEFPRVAVGAHTIEVVPDNLPLPWFIDEGGERRAVEVRVRESARVEIGARRQR